MDTNLNQNNAPPPPPAPPSPSPATPQRGERRLAVRVVVVLAVGVGLGLIANLIPTIGIDFIGDWDNYIERQAESGGFKVIDLPTTRTMVDAGETIIFDARAMKDFKAGHLPGALPWPSKQKLEHADAYGFLTPQMSVLVYCTGGECDESRQVAEVIKQMGVTNIYIFVDGYRAWTQAGYAVEKGD